MKIFDRFLKAASDLHAKRTAPAPGTMPLAAPVREAGAPSCVTCEQVWNGLDALARTMPASTDVDHFLKSVTTWLVGASLQHHQTNPKPLMADVVDALQASGIRVVTAPLSGVVPFMSPGGPRAH